MHGVYKPGNVKLKPAILQASQAHIQAKHGTAANPVNFVFHGGSGSTPQEIAEAISYGVVKMNIDTDLQWALWDGIRQYDLENHDYLQGQLGNPKGADAPEQEVLRPARVAACRRGQLRRLAWSRPSPSSATSTRSPELRGLAFQQQHGARDSAARS